ncbi:hypothetical protein WKT20_05165, partial [Phocaeicola sp. ICN-14070]|uniref:hypothetical protein n=1 Tax=Phocaeicola sp. ICN-14070 TaxID=3134656 RepID=UPI0030BFF313
SIHFHPHSFYFGAQRYTKFSLIAEKSLPLHDFFRKSKDFWITINKVNKYVAKRNSHRTWH